MKVDWSLVFEKIFADEAGEWLVGVHLAIMLPGGKHAENE